MQMRCSCIDSALVHCWAIKVVCLVWFASPTLSSLCRWSVFQRIPPRVVDSHARQLLSPASNILTSGGSHIHYRWTTCTAPCLNCIDCLLRGSREACKRTELAINQSPQKAEKPQSQRPNASTPSLTIPFMIRRKGHRS
ncbi:hypothetical protein CCMA1212_007916 [Trichoderma ghanense]|uniref:Secreted protein n=1 Tax=Trichoderma ghanense TaxID=65468 RepID=A0ABY2GX37_9HYPO